jgi:hypothetical protein
VVMFLPTLKLTQCGVWGIFGDKMLANRDADKSLAFVFSYLQHNQNNFSLEQRSHKCVELGWGGRYVE